MSFIKFNGQIDQLAGELIQFAIQLSQFPNPASVKVYASDQHLDELFQIAQHSLPNEQRSQLGRVEQEFKKLVSNVFSIEEQEIPFLLVHREFQNLNKLMADLQVIGELPDHLILEFECSANRLMRNLLDHKLLLDAKQAKAPALLSRFSSIDQNEL